MHLLVIELIHETLWTLEKLVCHVNAEIMKFEKISGITLLFNYF